MLGRKNEVQLLNEGEPSQSALEIPDPGIGIGRRQQEPDRGGVLTRLGFRIG